MKPRLKRLNSLDALRGLAVILMFIHHFPKWLMINPGESDVYGCLFIISRFSTPMFLFIAGISLVLSAQKHRDTMLQHSLKRGVFLITCGFLLNTISPHNPLTLNILHTIGLSLILLTPLSTKPTRINCFIHFIILAIASEVTYKLPAFKRLLDMFHFPILPWITFTVFGVAAGGILIRLHRHKKINKFPRYLEFLSILSMLFACILVNEGVPFSYRAYCTLPFIMLSTSLILYTTAVFFWIYEVYRQNPFPIKPLITYGRYALFISQV